ncbi:hypothetical protein EDC94DRAFT_580370 [Helicostylum pulchrum]|nr:hypothetical protein EDC94DRAFT_580370 [Helicostylum pulchrum]
MGIQSKWKPSEDLMSKLALSHSKIIDLVVPFIADACFPVSSYTAAQTDWPGGSWSDIVYAPRAKPTIGTDAPLDSYSAAQTKWADGSESDTVYASQVIYIPSVLIESQYYVNEDLVFFGTTA